MVDVRWSATNASTPLTASMPAQTPARAHFQFKVVLVGDAFVGKTSVLMRYIHGDSGRPSVSSGSGRAAMTPETGSARKAVLRTRLPLEEAQKTITRSDKVAKLTVWDTAGM